MNGWLVISSKCSMYRAHSGAAIAEELLTVMREFKISDRVGYFVADNASNNDTTLREMA